MTRATRTRCSSAFPTPAWLPMADHTKYSPERKQQTTSALETRRQCVLAICACPKKQCSGHQSRWNHLHPISDCCGSARPNHWGRRTQEAKLQVCFYRCTCCLKTRPAVHHGFTCQRTQRQPTLHRTAPLSLNGSRPANQTETRL